MMNEVFGFRLRGMDLRSVVIDNEPWIVAQDVCRMLNLKDVEISLTMVDAGYKKRVDRSFSPYLFKRVDRRRQWLDVVNEDGIYSLLDRQQMEANKVRRHVADAISETHFRIWLERGIHGMAE